MALTGIAIERDVALLFGFFTILFTGLGKVFAIVF